MANTSRRYRVTVLGILTFCLPGIFTIQITKWCLNEMCTEPMFESTTTRAMNFSDTNFLSFVEGTPLKITAFMFSNQPHFMEAMTTDKRIGKIYSKFIDQEPLIRYLKFAIDSKQEYYMVTERGDAKTKPVKVEKYEQLHKLYEKKVAEMKEQAEVQAQRENEEKSDAAKSISSVTSKMDDANINEPSKETISSEKIEKTPIQRSKETTHPIEESMPNLRSHETTVAFKQEPSLTTMIAAEQNLLQVENVVTETFQATKEASQKSVTIEPHEIIMEASLESGTQGQEEPKIESSSVPYDSIVNKGLENDLDVQLQRQNRINTVPTVDRKVDQSAQTTVTPDREKLSNDDNVPEETLTIDNVVGKKENFAAKNTQTQKTDEIPELLINASEPLNIEQPNHQPQGVEEDLEKLLQQLDEKEIEKMEEEWRQQQQITPNTIDIEATQTTTNSPRKLNLEDLSKIDEANRQEASKSNSNSPVTEAQLRQDPITAALPSIPPIPPSQTNDAVPLNEPSTENIINTFQPITVNDIKNDIPVENTARNEDSTHSQNIQGQQNHNDVSKSDSLKYCHKDTCDSISEAMIGESLALASIGAIQNSTLRPLFNAYMHDLRLMLPFPFCEFDNTGVIMFAFLFVIFIIHLVNIAFSSSEPQQDVVDKRLLHDCMTRLKEQEVELTKSRVNATNAHQLAEAKTVIQKLHTMNNELRTENAKFDANRQQQADKLAEYEDKIKQNARHVQDIETSLRLKDREIENLTDSLKGASVRNDTLSEKLAGALGQAESLRQNNESLELEAEMLRNQLKDVRDKLEITEKELHVSKETNSNLHKQLDQYMIVIDELQLKVANVQAFKLKAKRIKGVNAETETKSADSSDSSGNVLVEASSMLIAECELNPVNEHDDNGNGSGGSGAWSDFSEMDAADDLKKDIEKSASRKILVDSGPMASRSKSKVRSELFEIVELKRRIRALESECDTLRSTVTVEQKEKEVLNQALEQLKGYLAEKCREAEQRESDRQTLNSQNQKFFHMVEERNNTVREKEEELKQLNERLSQSERELRNVEDEKRELASKVRELELSLRKSQDANTKLENSKYHEERRLLGKIAQLEEQLSNLHSMSPNASAMGDLNLSGNLSDREFGPRMPPREMPSLWSDVGSDLQYDSLFDLERHNIRRRSSRKSLQALTTSADVSGELSSRASPFELEQIWMNRPNSIKEKRNNGSYRARSRSTGRQSVPTGRQSARLVGVMPSPSSNLNALYLQK